MNPKNQFHIPIIAGLFTVCLLTPTITEKYYGHVIMSQLEAASEATGVFTFGKYIPISTQVAPTTYKYVKLQKQGVEITETYYAVDGQVTKAKYRNLEWQRSEVMSYNEKYIFIWPLLGFTLIGFAAASRTLRLLTKGKITEYVWNANDYWKCPFKEFEKVALIYGLSLFIAGFFS